MYVLYSWGIFAVAVAGAGYYYTTSGGQKKRGRSWKPFTPAQARRRESSKQRNDSRNKRRKDSQDRAAGDIPDAHATSAQTSGSESTKKRKGKKPQPSKLAQSTGVEVQEQDEERQEAEEEDLEFAKQFQDARTGTSLKRQDGPQNKKARKQAKRAEAALAAQNAPSSNGAGYPLENSTASSTTGADADDDLSSSTSLDLGVAPSGADVSDMLEAPAKGPSILRITEPTNSQPQKQHKPSKPQQEPESKKQRQNRQKREADKAQREQDEKERQKLLENQRRTAREARGEPAKNGLGTSQQPAKNAWTGVSKAGGNSDTLAKTPASNGPLLDTFADDSKSARAPAESPHINGRDHYNSLPSEEEQMKMLSEMDSDNGWNTVSKGGKKQKPQSSNIPNGVTGSDSAFPKGAPGTALNAQANGIEPRAAKTVKGAKAGKKATNGKMSLEEKDGFNRENIHEHPNFDPANPYALVGHPNGESSSHLYVPFQIAVDSR